MSTKNSYRILGIDPGTAIVGWGIIDVNKKDHTVHAVAYGHITTNADASDVERLSEIAHDLQDVIATHRPQEVAIEDLFFFKNQKTIITVAQARGVILYICHTKHLPTASYTPLQVKQALTGYGRANKKQMQDVIMHTLGLPAIPQPDDTADALAIALCHNNSRAFKKYLP